MVPSRSQFTSLTRGKRDDAREVRIKDSSFKGSANVFLKDTIVIGKNIIATPMINQVMWFKQGTSVFFNFKLCDSPDAYFELGRGPPSDKFLDYLKNKRVSVMETTADALVPMSSSSNAPSLPKIGDAPKTANSGPLISEGMIRAKPRAVEEIFPASTRSVRKFSDYSKPPRGFRVDMLSGANTDAGKPTTTLAPKTPEKRKADGKQSPAKVPKPASSPKQKLEDMVALVDPTDKFIKQLKDQGYAPIKYPFKDGRTITLPIKSMARLEDNVFLDDSLISFFLKLYHQEMPDPSSTHIFSTFFFPGMENGDKIHKWISKVDLTKKRMLIVPIHQRYHWSVVVVLGVDTYLEDNKKFPSLVYFDSLGSNHQNANVVFRKCVKILAEIFESLEKSAPASRQYRKIVAQVPVQSNSSDCGVFLIDFMRHVMAEPEKFEQVIASVAAKGKKEFKFSDAFPGPLFNRAKFLELLKEMGTDHPDTAHNNAENDGPESDIEEFSI